MPSVLERPGLSATGTYGKGTDPVLTPQGRVAKEQDQTSSIEKDQSILPRIAPPVGIPTPEVTNA